MTETQRSESAKRRNGILLTNGKWKASQRGGDCGHSRSTHRAVKVDNPKMF